MLTIYVPVHEAAHIYFCPDQKDLLGTLQEVQPTSLFGVPRVWQKMQAGILALMAAEQDETKKAAVARAMDAGRAYVEGCQFGHQVTPEVAEAFERADAEVLGPIRSLLGLGKTVATLSAAAPLPAGGRQVLRRPRHEDPRCVRDDRDHRRGHREHAGRVPARHGRAGRCPAWKSRPPRTGRSWSAAR